MGESVQGTMSAYITAEHLYSFPCWLKVFLFCSITALLASLAQGKVAQCTDSHLICCDSKWFLLRTSNSDVILLLPHKVLFNKVKQFGHKWAFNSTLKYMSHIKFFRINSGPFLLQVAEPVLGPLNTANFANASQLQKHLCWITLSYFYEKGLCSIMLKISHFLQIQIVHRTALYDIASAKIVLFSLREM